MLSIILGKLLSAVQDELKIRPYVGPVLHSKARQNVIATLGLLSAQRCTKMNKEGHFQ